jgi:hypothetical protein
MNAHHNTYTEFHGIFNLLFLHPQRKESYNITFQSAAICIKSSCSIVSSALAYILHKAHVLLVKSIVSKATGVRFAHLLTPVALYKAHDTLLRCDLVCKSYEQNIVVKRPPMVAGK